VWRKGKGFLETFRFRLPFSGGEIRRLSEWRVLWKAGWRS
jgi:hypothetical protein